MASTLVAGFTNPAYDSQITFRALLNALAQPGQPQSINLAIETPSGIYPAYASACLTLLDLETQVWVQSGLGVDFKDWLSFHTGCQLTENPKSADFALIYDLETLPELSCFHWGTELEPESSTTLLIPVSSWESGLPVALKGPGILGERIIAPNLTRSFWDCWVGNHQAYPLGVDVFLFTEDKVMGLPRSVNCDFERF